MSDVLPFPRKVSRQGATPAIERVLSPADDNAAFEWAALAMAPIGLAIAAVAAVLVARDFGGAACAMAGAAALGGGCAGSAIAGYVLVRA